MHGQPCMYWLRLGICNGSIPGTSVNEDVCIIQKQLKNSPIAMVIASISKPVCNIECGTVVKKNVKLHWYDK